MATISHKHPTDYAVLRGHMNEYLITLTDDNAPPVSITLTQQEIDTLLNEYALAAAVRNAEHAGDRTAEIGILEVSNDAEPVWNGQIVDQQVFANMVGDALVLNAVKYAQKVLDEQATQAQEPRADN